MGWANAGVQPERPQLRCLLVVRIDVAADPLHDIAALVSERQVGVAAQTCPVTTGASVTWRRQKCDVFRFRVTSRTRWAAVDLGGLHGDDKASVRTLVACHKRLPAWISVRNTHGFIIACE